MSDDDKSLHENSNEAEPMTTKSSADKEEKKTTDAPEVSILSVPVIKIGTNMQPKESQNPLEVLVGEQTISDIDAALVEAEERNDKEIKKNKKDLVSLEITNEEKRERHKEFLEEIDKRNASYKFSPTIVALTPSNSNDKFNKEVTSDIQNRAVLEGKLIIGAVASPSKDFEKKDLADGDGLSLLTSAMGIESKVRFPLWNSGFAIVIDDINRFDVRKNLMSAFTALKSEFNVSAASFLAPEMLPVRLAIVNIVLDYVKGVNIAGAQELIDSGDKEGLKSLIKRNLSVFDYDAIATAYLTATNPSGYPLTVQCGAIVAETNTRCDYVYEPQIMPGTTRFAPQTLIDLSQVIRERTPKFKNPDHLKMVKGVKMSTEEELEGYRKWVEETFRGSELISTDLPGEANKTVTIRGRIPVMSEEEQYYEQWKVKVEALSNEWMSIDEAENRKESIKLAQDMLMVRLDFMWVGKAFLHETGNINNVFNIVSEKDSIIFIEKKLPETMMPDVISGFQKYKSLSSASVCALPNFPCPKCNNPVSDDTDIQSYKRFYPFHAFFIIAGFQ